MFYFVPGFWYIEIGWLVILPLLGFSCEIKKFTWIRVEVIFRLLDYIIRAFGSLIFGTV